MPLATYRVQLTGQSGFREARAIVPYLHRLGVTDLYTSPVLQASPGSMHGYDTTDPTRLNPELGTEQDFDALAAELSGLGMGLLLDIVPNHMAASPDNPWWLDVLEHGQTSIYADFFDIDWHPAWGHVHGRVVLPVLGKPYSEALDGGEVTLSLEEDGLFVRYYGLRLPLEVKSWALLLEHCLATADASFSGEVMGLLDMARRLPDHALSEGQGRAEAYAQRREGTVKLWNAINAGPGLRGLLADAVDRANGRQSGPELLDRLLSLQPYQLVYWRTGLEKLNYRRFFDISSLVGVRVELPKVLGATHALTFRLVRQQKVTGLRIDHIDGLRDPHEYLLRLQTRLSASAQEQGSPTPQNSTSGLYMLVEKILGGDESLPEEWPVSGTTGYDFLNLVNAVFVSREGARALERAQGASFEDVVYHARKQVIERLFPAETFALCQRLASLAQYDRVGCDLRREDMARALVEVTACMPVYRTYIRGMEVAPRDRAYVEQAVRRAREHAPALEPRALDFLRRVLLLETQAPQQEALDFVMTWQQSTGPVMAKGLEDTALYRYNALVSLNDVGGGPGAVDFSVQVFHQRNAERQSRWPHTLNTTSTHDTKRSEDVRARINVLSEMPDAWSRRLAAWSRWNRPGKRLVRGALVPGLNEERLLYQTMLGAWPLVEEEVPRFAERLKGYMLKAVREAREHTDWLSPDTEYEAAIAGFIDYLFQAPEAGRFLADFRRFQRRIAHFGWLNSLSQLVLKAVSPGVPDFYQGTELWDFSLVDPDNRRPVDYARRSALLEELLRQETHGRLALARRLVRSWSDGRVKLYTTLRLLRTRGSNPALFLEGEYLPLQARGVAEEHVCAYARRHGDTWAVAVVPRLLVKLVRPGALPLGKKVWGEDTLLLPRDAPARWENVFTGEAIDISAGGSGLPLAPVFASFPVAVLQGADAGAP